LVTRVALVGNAPEVAERLQAFATWRVSTRWCENLGSVIEFR